MKESGNIRNWKEGDKRDIKDRELKTLYENGLYDSYDRTYRINGLKWKIVSKLVNPDLSVVYTLECMGTGDEY